VPDAEAYAAAGVSISASDRAVAAIVGALREVEVPKRTVDLPGHYASVLRVSDDLGIAFATDGVGSKLVVAEQTGRLDTVGIDCVAMNVNDIICVGAEPIALVDYVAVEEPDEQRLASIARGLARGAQDANIEIPGGELAVLPELIRGHPSPLGFDLCASVIGTVKLDAIVTGKDVTPGDALVGLPSSGLHSNGYTLARRALASLDYDDAPPELGGQTVADVLLEPTVIYVRAVLELLRSDIPVHGLAHITGGGVDNLKRLRDDVAYTVTDALPVPPVFGLVQRLGEVSDDEMTRVFNMGCGFVCVVPPEHADAAVELLAARHPGTRVIGEVQPTRT
jgi:phosphoribosylformylglycinamidine cyclo-ligase